MRAGGASRAPSTAIPAPGPLASAAARSSTAGPSTTASRVAAGLASAAETDGADSPTASMSAPPTASRSMRAVIMRRSSFR
jgi:hypothetical protein